VRRFVLLLVALMFTFTALVGCRQEEETDPVDLSPMPAAAAPPYVCEYIPLRAVELMTGVRDPLVSGSFDFSDKEGHGVGSCAIYRPDGNRLKVMLVELIPGDYTEFVQGYIDGGFARLPEIIPGSIGAYSTSEGGKNNAAYAYLATENTELVVQMDYGAPGRDNAADVVALMKLIAPKLLSADNTPSASPTASASPTVKKSEEPGEG